MTLDDFLDEFRRQRVFVQHGQRAPHKALALLYAMGRLQGGERMTRYQDGAAAIAALLERFGPRRDVQRPSQPIWRLRPRGATRHVGVPGQRLDRESQRRRYSSNICGKR